jgi:hypothetical protein
LKADVSRKRSASGDISGKRQNAYKVNLHSGEQAAEYNHEIIALLSSQDLIY